MAPCANGPVQLSLVTVLPSRRSGVRVWVRGVDYSWLIFLRKNCQGGFDVHRIIITKYHRTPSRRRTKGICGACSVAVQRIGIRYCDAGVNYVIGGVHLVPTMSISNDDYDDDGDQACALCCHILTYSASRFNINVFFLGHSIALALSVVYISVRLYVPVGLLLLGLAPHAV